MGFLFTTLYESQQHEQYTLEEAYTIFSSHGFIDHGELAEKALSKASGIAQCGRNNPESDLINGVQIKHALTNYDTQAHTGSLKGYVTIKGPKKDGKTIFAVVTETLTNTEYFFIFPHSSFIWRDGNTMSIPFDVYGNPRRSNDLWSYEVKIEEFVEAIRAH